MTRTDDGPTLALQIADLRTETGSQHWIGEVDRVGKALAAGLADKRRAIASQAEADSALKRRQDELLGDPFVDGSNLEKRKGQHAQLVAADALCQTLTKALAAESDNLAILSGRVDSLQAEFKALDTIAGIVVAEFNVIAHMISAGNVRSDNAALPPVAQPPPMGGPVNLLSTL